MPASTPVADLLAALNRQALATLRGAPDPGIDREIEDLGLRLRAGPRLEPGRRLGPWELREIYEERPFHTRWWARDAQGRLGMVFVFRDDHLSDPVALTTFLRAAARLGSMGTLPERPPTLLGAESMGGLVFVQVLPEETRAPPPSPTWSFYLDLVGILAWAHRAGCTHGALDRRAVLVCGPSKAPRPVVIGWGLPDVRQAVVSRSLTEDLLRSWPPEVIQGEEPSPAADVFSLALLGRSWFRQLDPREGLDRDPRLRPADATLWLQRLHRPRRAALAAVPPLVWAVGAALLGLVGWLCLR